MSGEVTLLHESELAKWGPRKSGGRLRAYCPVHGGDHQRSLEIRLEDDGPFKRGYGFCHNCKATVFVIEIDPRRAESIERAQQGDGRGALANIDLLKPRSRAASQPEQWQQEERTLLTTLYPRMRAALAQLERPQTYLRERAIPLEVAQAAGVVYLPASALQNSDLQAQRHLVSKWVDRLIFPLWATDGRRGYAGRTLQLWQPGMDENEHKVVLEAHDQRAGRDESRKIRRWRKTNPAGYFGVGPKALSPCIAVVEGAFDRLALLASGLKPPGVIALVGTALHAEALPLQVQSVVLALDGDVSGQQAAQKLRGELQIAGLGASVCGVPQDGRGKDWSERYRLHGRTGLVLAFPPEFCTHCGMPSWILTDDQNRAYCKACWRALGHEPASGEACCACGDFPDQCDDDLLERDGEIRLYCEACWIKYKEQG